MDIKGLLRWPSIPLMRLRSSSSTNALAVIADDGHRTRVVAIERANDAGRLVAVHLGHLDVHEIRSTEPGWRALERAHGLGARGCRQDLGTRHGQHLGGYLAVELVVFGDDDAPAGEIVRNSVAVRSGPRGERIVARGGPFAEARRTARPP